MQLLAAQEGSRRTDCCCSQPTRYASASLAGTGVWQLGDLLFVVAAILAAGAVIAAARVVIVAIGILLAELGDTLADTFEARGSFIAAIVRVLVIDAALDVAAGAAAADTRAAIGVGFAGVALTNAIRIRKGADAYAISDARGVRIATIGELAVFACRGAGELACPIDALLAVVAARVTIAACITQFDALRFRLGTGPIDTNQAIAALEFRIADLAARRHRTIVVNALQALVAAFVTLGAAIVTFVATFRLRELTHAVNTLEAPVTARKGKTGFSDPRIEAEVVLISANRHFFFTDALLVTEAGAAFDCRLLSCRNQAARFSNIGTSETAGERFGIANKALATLAIALGSESGASRRSIANSEVSGECSNSCTEHAKHTPS